MNYSIVIPVHNESLHLERSVTTFIRNLLPDIKPVRIFLVENGSQDDTLLVCNRLKELFPNLIQVLSIARGSYGEAIKIGMLECKSEYVSILECDFLDKVFLVDSQELVQSQEARFIVASKRHPKSIDKRPIKRRILTTLYNYIFLRLSLGYPGTDTHGLKCIETSLAKQLCELASTTDEIFQTEIVLIAWRLGVKIYELPIKIIETRSAPVSVRKRLPKVLLTVSHLKRSLQRFPKKTASPSAALSNKSGY